MYILCGSDHKETVHSRCMGSKCIFRRLVYLYLIRPNNQDIVGEEGRCPLGSRYTTKASIDWTLNLSCGLSFVGVTGYNVRTSSTFKGAQA